MAEQRPEDSSQSPQARVKRAACLVCRRSKIKCDWIAGEGRCKRCSQLDADCVRPDFHPGRQKGIKNKRVGLEKAVYQVEQAVKRLKSRDSRKSHEDEKIVSQLRSLLSGNKAAPDLPSNLESRAKDHGKEEENEDQGGEEEEDDEDDDEEHREERFRSYDGHSSSIRSETDMGSTSMSNFGAKSDNPLAVDDAENPLQLLARASYLKPSDNSVRKHPSPLPQHKMQASWGGSSEDPIRLNEFFSSTTVHLDIGDDVDPILLGLVTVEESESLLSFFHTKLAHTRWGIDARIYDFKFIRSRSAFLLTSILSATTLFLPEAGALSKRLFNHVRFLAQHIVSTGCKSVEIVLAFMVNVPWMFPGKHSTDDEACRFISLATSIAIDLSLHRIIMPLERPELGSSRSLARSDCLDPKTALVMDGYEDVDPWTERAQLLLRSRERCWISLFVLERGMSLARGRPYVVPITRSIRDCDGWHRSPLADQQDGPVVSMAVLRRDLDGMFSAVRSLCDGSTYPSSDGSLIAQSIESTMEKFFDSWFSEWGPTIGTGPQRSLPPYVDILVTHTRLSGYANVINHPTAPMEVRHFFRKAGLSSALNVLRVAIQGESQLQSMPNNTAIMISFAACFALTLSAYTSGVSALAPSVRKLIDEVAGVLERLGTVTPHRNGLSVLYGKYLAQVVQRAAGEQGDHSKAIPVEEPQSDRELTNHAPMNLSYPVSSLPPPAEQSPHSGSAGASFGQPAAPLLWPEPIQFSAMSNDEISQALDQPGNEFQPSFDGFSWNDMNNFDWLYWPSLGQEI